LQLSLSLEHGVGVSLINSVPEELLFATFSGIRVSGCSWSLRVGYRCVCVCVYIHQSNLCSGPLWHGPLVLWVHSYWASPEWLL